MCAWGQVLFIGKNVQDLTNTGEQIDDVVVDW